ncbi:hypothetical protein [Candidatus Nitrotoga sp. 1052]|uniref:hypothetical protein n=1 Tax=Candidatus Nitrotoga sp. 1052 TaxID=2886964 RepID=UPI001EF5B496|nr:hypothetical protein [Candidatus Nitrotoga sp. 1052]CAH1087015.1 hypothetical protein NTG1052_580001 [Candidatus Nitrotoga sp. 1052]
MARPLRLEFSGALDYVTSRGDRREDIFLSPIDQVTQVADPMDGTTQINYRADRNLGSVVNPLGNTVESYDYDLAGWLTKQA